MTNGNDELTLIDKYVEKPDPAHSLTRTQSHYPTHLSHTTH
jgi:hypothetical protein